MLSVPNWLCDGLGKQKINESKRNCNIFKDSCFERLGGYLTIPFKQVLKNLPIFRWQSVKKIDAF